MITLTTFTEAVKAGAPEADVVLIVWNEESQQYRIIPKWECTDNLPELSLLVIAEAVRFSETIGHGPVEACIIDLR